MDIPNITEESVRSQIAEIVGLDFTPKLTFDYGYTVKNGWGITGLGGINVDYAIPPYPKDRPIWFHESLELNDIFAIAGFGHEVMHIVQAFRIGDGSKFMRAYNDYTLRVGYEENPFEVEATQAGCEVVRKLLGINYTIKDFWNRVVEYTTKMKPPAPKLLEGDRITFENVEFSERAESFGQFSQGGVWKRVDYAELGERSGYYTRYFDSSKREVIESQ